MNVALWTAAGLLAAVFLASSAKLMMPKEKIAGMGAAAKWVEDFSPGALKALGALELLAAEAATTDHRNGGARFQTLLSHSMRPERAGADQDV